jgi:hypothetical protein
MRFMAFFLGVSFFNFPCATLADCGALCDGFVACGEWQDVAGAYRRPGLNKRRNRVFVV